MKDQRIIELLSKRDGNANLALKSVYRTNQNRVLAMVKNNNGDADAGHEVLQEAIIVFYERVKNKGFEPKAKISTFIYRVAKNLWFDELKRRNQQVNDLEVDDSLDESPSPAEKLLDRERRALLLDVVEGLKPDCQRILQLSIYEGLSMQEISHLMNFKNEQIARNKKSKCLNYLRRIVKENAYIFNIVKELR